MDFWDEILYKYYKIIYGTGAFAMKKLWALYGS